MEDRPTIKRFGLSGDPAEESVAYRPVSSLAVAGGLLALASTLAVVTPWLAGAPLAAAVLCYAAARSIAANPDARTGLPIALVGLAISCAVAATTFARDRFAASLHAAQADPVAEAFLNALAAGDTATARDLTLDYADRQPGPDAVAQHYRSDEKAAGQLREFAAQAAVQTLSAQRVTPVETPSAVSANYGRLSLTRRYRVADGAPGDAREVVVRLDRPQRSPPTAAASWRVAEVGLDRGGSE